MGEVTVPSGTLHILDPGHIGMFENGDIEEIPAVIVNDLPRDRPLPVWGVRVGEGRWAALWDRVVIELRDADLAAAVSAPALENGNFGWRDLDVDEIVERGQTAEKLKAERGWKLATDFRPHSHHWAALELARAAETESGTIDVDDLRVCLFFTAWGDGMFPVFADLGADGKPVQIRIQLHTDDSDANMAAVND